METSQSGIKVKQFNFKEYAMLFAYSVLIGVVVSILVTIFHLFSKETIAFSNQIYDRVYKNPILILAVIPLVIVIAVVFVLCFQYLNICRGSGKNDALNYARGTGEFDWKRAIFSSFLLTQLTFLLGLSLGEEAPSVVMGIATAMMLKQFFKISDSDRLLEIAGGSVGFAIAFNAPLAGIIYSYEDIHGKKFTFKSLFAVVVSIGSAKLITYLYEIATKQTIDIFKFHNVAKLPPNAIQYAVLGGILIPLFVYAYNFIIILIFKAKKHFPKKHDIFRIPFAMLVVVLLSIMIRELVGAGGNIIHAIQNNEMMQITSIILLIAGSFYTISLSYLSDAPGGLIFPTLAFGSLVGFLIMKLLYKFDFSKSAVLPKEFQFTMIIIFMFAFFSSSFFLPMTSIVLFIEAIRYNVNIYSIVSIVASVLFSYLITRLLKTRPIYEHLVRVRNNDDIS